MDSVEYCLTQNVLDSPELTGFSLRILKIAVKCGPPERVGVLPYLSIETFQKVGVRNEKLE